METGVDDTGKDNENEEQTSGNRGPIYYEERVQVSVADLFYHNIVVKRM